jgi:small subunit ribosomal protein S16
MVKLRLARAGAKKKAYYRIVAADERYPRDGRFLEQVGTYDPRQDPAKVTLVKDALEKWLKNGAQPTETVAQLVRRHAEGNTVVTEIRKAGQARTAATLDRQRTLRKARKARKATVRAAKKTATKSSK